MTSFPTMDVKATLIPVAQELHAMPGHHLMVVAGVCVGVFTGALPPQGAAPALPAPAPAAGKAPRRARGPVGAPQGAPKPPGRTMGSAAPLSGPKKADIIACLLRVVRNAPGANSIELLKGISINEKVDVAIVREVFYELSRKKKIRLERMPSAKDGSKVYIVDGKGSEA